MGETSIEWTDRTWNPVTGCTKISPGCKNCYAERIFPRTAHGQVVQVNSSEGIYRPRQFTDVLTHANRLDQPLRWRKPQRIFVNSMSDLFHEDVDSEFITKVFSVMAAASWHTFQILTKRPLRMFRYIESHKRSLSAMSDVWPLPNVWLGISAENQEYAAERIPLLLQTPAAVWFVSYEPALGLVDFKFPNPYERIPGGYRGDRPELMLKPAWVIVGGESGPSARPFNIEWARDVVRQCREAGVACFVKQLGAKPFWPYSDGTPFSYPELQDKKGGDISEWPDDLRIREFPYV